MRNNLGLILEKRAQLDGAREALVEVERGRRYTYAQLDRRSHQVANSLLACGTRRGERVALLLMNGVEYLETYFAVARIGAVMVPLNWRLVGEELEYILRDAGASVLVYGSEFDEVVEQLATRDLPIRSWLRVGADPVPEGRLSYEQLREAASTLPPPVVASDDDLLFLMYTSGTTGHPKGVMHTHDSMLWASLTVLLTAELARGDRYLQVLPLFHVGALTPATAALHRGAALVMTRSFDPNGVFEVIEREQVTLGFAVPAMLQFMWAMPARATADLSSLRYLISGAAPLPVAVIEQYASAGVEVHQVYGLTESAGPATLISPDDALRKAGSAGPPFFHTDVRIVDPDGKDVPRGEVGEVWIRGRHVMAGYWNQPEATAEVLVDGWLRSGDMALMDEEGHVYIQDRAKDMIISGGENVYPAQIENVLLGHASVSEVAVIGMSSARWGESPAAIVVPAAETPDPGSILSYAREHLAGFKVPRVIEFVEALPRNSTGKVLKRELRERFPGPAPE